MRIVFLLALALTSPLVVPINALILLWAANASAAGAPSTEGLLTITPTATQMFDRAAAPSAIRLSGSRPGADIPVVSGGKTGTLAAPDGSSGPPVPAAKVDKAIAKSADFPDPHLVNAPFSSSQSNSFTVPLSAVSLGRNANLNGFKPFPGSAIWMDISSSPVDTAIDPVFRSIWGRNGLHPDGGSSSESGIGYYVIDEDATPNLLHIPTKCSTADKQKGGDKIASSTFCPESDDVPMPLTLDMRQEGGTKPLSCWTADGDHHLVILERKRGVLYESYQLKTCNGVAVTYSMKTWDVSKALEAGQNSFARTSSDAAGLSTFMGALGVRYEEIQAGHIDHAIRMTLRVMNCAFYANGNGHALVALPATHGSNCGGGNYSAYYGMRFRLKPNFDISSYSRTNQVILTAAKKYGFIIADIGGNAYFQLTPDPRWNDNDLSRLSAVHLADFQVVDSGTRYGVDLPTETGTNGVISLYDQTGVTSSATVGRVVSPALPQPGISSFTASARSIAVGQPVTFTGLATHSGESYVENAGVLIHNMVTIIPDHTRTYSMVALGLGGYKHSSEITVTVTGTQVSKPAASVKGGTYASPQKVALTSTGTIHYTTDGTLATCYSPMYSSPLAIGTIAGVLSTRETINVQAVGCANGQLTSDVLNNTYIIKQALSGLSVVQKTAGAVTGTSASPAAISFPVSPAPGNMLLAFITSWKDSPLILPRDWTLVTSTTHNDNLLSVYRTTTSGSGTYNIRRTDNGQLSAIIYEIQGSSGVDTFSNASVAMTVRGRTTTHTTPPAKPTVAGDLAFGAVSSFFQGGSATATTPGWTMEIAPAVTYQNMSVAVRDTLTSDISTPVSVAFTGPEDATHDTNGGSDDVVTVLVKSEGAGRSGAAQ